MQSADLKLRRAESLRQDLMAWGEAWSKTSVPLKAELGENRLGCRLILGEIPHFDDLETRGVLLGEYVHNLRSALDNLAYSLALKYRTPPEDPSGISFRIFIEKAEFQSKSKRTLGQIEPEAARLISNLQPFQRNELGVEGTPASDPLSILQRLSNHDKHRVPAVVLIAPREISFHQGVLFYSEADAAANVPPEVIVNGGPLKPGTVLLEHCTKAPIKQVVGKFDMKCQIAIQLEGEQMQFGKTVADLIWYVNLVVDEFRRFF